MNIVIQLSFRFGPHSHRIPGNPCPLHRHRHRPSHAYISRRLHRLHRRCRLLLLIIPTTCRAPPPPPTPLSRRGTPYRLPARGAYRALWRFSSPSRATYTYATRPSTACTHCACVHAVEYGGSFTVRRAYYARTATTATAAAGSTTAACRAPLPSSSRPPPYLPPRVLQHATNDRAVARRCRSLILLGKCNL